MAVLKCTVENITPEIAKNYLAMNCDNNRRIQQRRVDVYAEMMKAGEWKLNGEGIHFDSNGHLLNGQHRLSAIVKSGVTVQMLVVKNAEGPFDRGQTRSTSQALGMAGLKEELANNTMCAVAKLFIRTYKTDNYVSDTAIRDFLLENETNLLLAYKIGIKGADSGKGGGSLRVRTNYACFILALFNALDGGESVEDLRAFCNVFVTGLPDNKNQSAAIVLRNDVLAGNIDYKKTERQKVAVVQIEKAISDFCHKVPRQITYKNWDKPVYRKKEG